MHSSWFPKPVYKRVRWLALFFLAGGLAYAYFNPGEWQYLFLVGSIWLIFSIICSFHIQSGAYINTIVAGSNDSDYIYFTFDDGPTANTFQIIEVLDRYNVKATFFITGKNAEMNPEIVKKLSEKGHCIGNHSYSHKSWLPILPVRKIRKEIAKTQSIITDISGISPRFFRPPFGVTNPLIAKALNPFSLKTVGWNIRSLDTIIKDPDQLINRIRKRLKPGSIVLLHDTSPHIGKVLDAVLISCHEMKIKPVSLNEL